MAAVKYKPQLYIRDGCASFPAVNAAGDITGGLQRNSMVLWTDNLAVKTPQLLGASLSQQILKPPKVIFILIGEHNQEPYQRMTEFPRIF
ncbi:Necrosis inducing protein NPP1 [Phytophthora megakarya]|uniref:Necrosis inducing protein NPP1 n=1 Tax=Phytophthora megakarya TaxID=4795 RepID=A0A225UT91_9STRA|nr:Necrosis inducing protein NPP1 [Phytophthora megakarya]